MNSTLHYDKAKYMKYIILISSLFTTQIIFGQSFKWVADLGEITHSGYHDIELNAEMIGQLNHIYTDIRILEENNQEIAYISSISEKTKESIEAISIQQKDTNKTSIYTIDFDRKYHFVAYKFVVAEPDLFVRQGILKRINKEREVEKTMSITLSSKKDNVFQVPSFDALSTCVLEIDNKDDAPITLDKVIGLQRKITLTTPLKKGRQYRLVFGSPNLKAPVYDLNFFKDELPKNRRKISLTNYEENEKQAIKIEPVPIDVKKLQPDTPPNYLLWGVVGVILLIMAVMSWRMIREMGNR